MIIPLGLTFILAFAQSLPLPPPGLKYQLNYVVEEVNYYKMAVGTPITSFSPLDMVELREHRTLKQVEMRIERTETTLPRSLSSTRKRRTVNGRQRLAASRSALPAPGSIKRTGACTLTCPPTLRHKRGMRPSRKIWPIEVRKSCITSHCRLTRLQLIKYRPMVAR